MEDSTCSNPLNKASHRIMLYGILKHGDRKAVEKDLKKWFKEKEEEENGLQLKFIDKNNDKPKEDANEQTIQVLRVKKPPRAIWAMLTLANEAQAKKVYEFFKKYEFKTKKGNEITADFCQEEPKKRGREEDGGESKRHRKMCLLVTEDDVRDSATPFWKMTYEEQLAEKQKDMIKNCVTKAVQGVRNVFRNREKEMKRNPSMKNIPVYSWLKERRSVEVADIKSSPDTLEYRNKVELNFGYRYVPITDEINKKYKDLETVKDDEENLLLKVPSVGMMARGWSGGVSKPHPCANTPSEACGIVDILEEFLLTSEIKPYIPKIHVGVWRQITMRFSHRKNQCMIIIQHAPQTVSNENGSHDHSDIFEQEKERLVQMLTSKPIPLPDRDYPASILENFKKQCPNESSLSVTSIYFQEFDGLSIPPPEHPVQHVYGSEVIEEQLGDCTFQISPGAFFQVNTRACEVLYREVASLVKSSDSNKKVLLLDVCCGTGSIGIFSAKLAVCTKLVGIDISIPAIEDAKKNAKRNLPDSFQAEFVAARAELVIAKELEKIKLLKEEYEVVAVVDPAREGLHADVLKAIRSHDGIQRLVYVSCNPTKSLIVDTSLLCCPPSKKYTGTPFRVTAAQPVDLFPMTDHCEMVLTFERKGPESLSSSLDEEDDKNC